MPNFLLLTLLTAFPALSTDMYLPALPHLQQSWGISLMEANSSLAAFFACFSFFLLVHGPLSDRIGRKPVLIGGVSLYIVGSLLCAASNSIGWLVAARLVQATGAAAASSLAMALAKDLYEGVERQKVLAYIGVLLPLCPMIAPMLGGWMLAVASWRWIFICQGVAALATLYGSITLREPPATRTSGGLLAVAGRYLVVAKNRRFLAYVFSFSFMGIAFFAFIAGSPDIYIRGFGVGERAYGLYFGLNALGMMLGSLFCSRLCVGYSSVGILRVSLVGQGLAGAAMLLVAGTAPLTFTLPMLAVTFFMGMSRPVSNHLILEQVDSDVGAASSVLTFCLYMGGALAMAFISLGWQSKPLVIGSMALVGAAIPLTLVLLVGRRARKGEQEG